MKKLFLIFACLLSGLSLSSWGPVGHSTMAKIAQDHLSAKASQSVLRILNGQSMASVSSWADDRLGKQNPLFASWHKLILAGGLDYQQFKEEVQKRNELNLYSGINLLIEELRDDKISRGKKWADLQLLISLVADAHQPLNLGDQTGNKKMLKFKSQPVSLYDFWDKILVERDNNDITDSANKVDSYPSQQIISWQKDEILVWLYESYQISSKIHSDLKNKTEISPAYYNESALIAQKRLDVAGIRLAGILNDIYK